MRTKIIRLWFIDVKATGRHVFVDHVACLYTKYLVQRKDRLLLLKPRKVIKVAWGLVCVFSKGLVTNYGERGRGQQNGSCGRHVKFYPYEKRGAQQVLAMLRGGATRFEVVLLGSLKF